MLLIEGGVACRLHTSMVLGWRARQSHGSGVEAVPHWGADPV